MNYNKTIMNRIGKILVFFIIIFACTRLLYLFGLRTSYHIDEMYSYGFANSFYAPYLYKTSVSFRDTEAIDTKNIKEWIDGEVLLDQIAVDKDTTFRFDSVIYNKRYDDSPSLYELILHSVCSFFPDSFSLYYAFFINFFLYIVFCVILYLYTSQITQDSIGGIVSLLYFVFSGCLTANFLYLRIYALYSTLVLLLVYLFHRILYVGSENGSVKKSTYILYFVFLFMICFLGCFTHYFFLFIAFVLTALTDIFLLFQKRIKTAFFIGTTMLASVLFYYVVYPYGFEHIFSMVSGEDSFTELETYPYYWQLAYANRLFFKDTIGFYIDFHLADIVMFLGTMVLILLLVFLLYFLLRKEKITKMIMSGLKKINHHVRTFFSSLYKSFDISIYSGFLTGIVCLFFIPAHAILLNMGYADRYLFAPMILFMLFYSCFVYKLIRFLYVRLKKKWLKVISSVFLSAFLLVLPVVNTNYVSEEFLFNSVDTRHITELVSGKNCYVIMGTVRDLTWLSGTLYKSDHVFFDLSTDISSTDFVIPDLESGNIVLINDFYFLKENEDAINGSATFLDIDKTYDTEGMITVNDFVSEIEEESGLVLVKTEDWYSFVGKYEVYVVNQP